jgi:hypothetical protein
MSIANKKPRGEPDANIEVTLSSEDAEFQALRSRMSVSDMEEIAKLTIDHIMRHAEAHGSFTGFADFLAQCDALISQTRAGKSKVAVTLANSLARDISSIREMSEALSPEMKALLFRGFTTGYLFANLRRETADAGRVKRRPGAKKPS